MCFLFLFSLFIISLKTRKTKNNVLCLSLPRFFPLLCVALVFLRPFFAYYVVVFYRYLVILSQEFSRRSYRSPRHSLGVPVLYDLHNLPRHSGVSR